MRNKSARRGRAEEATEAESAEAVKAVVKRAAAMEGGERAVVTEAEKEGWAAADWVVAALVAEAKL